MGYDQAQRAIKPPANNQSQPDEESMKSYMASLPVMKEALDLVVTNEERAAEQVAALLQPAQQERAKGIIGKRRGQLESWREPLKRIPARGARRPDGTMPAGAPPR
ncbi:MAG: hypothetical protein MUF21_07165 [Gemmatimonadaceae bacterium]|nr:hypothetical protein [Gemmatimonadaceae bacterium]